MILNISNDNIICMLIKLDMSYCDDLEKWLLITNILKNAGCFEIWNDWSTMSVKYNYDTIVKIWNASAGLNDINYKDQVEKLPLVQRFKVYESISNKVTYNKQRYTNKWFNITDGEFNKYFTIIGHSCTETARAIKTYNDQQKKTI